MIIAFIYINFDRTSKNAKKCQKELGTFVSSKKCHEVSKNAKFAVFGTKNAKLATMLRMVSSQLISCSLFSGVDGAQPLLAEIPRPSAFYLPLPHILIQSLHLTSRECDAKAMLAVKFNFNL